MKTHSRMMQCIAASFALALALGAAPNARADDGVYLQHNLVSDGFVTADHTDTNLVNAWGVAFNPFGVVWVADNGTGLSTLYDGDGNVVVAGRADSDALSLQRRHAHRDRVQWLERSDQFRRHGHRFRPQPFHFRHRRRRDCRLAGWHAGDRCSRQLHQPPAPSTRASP